MFSFGMFSFFAARIAVRNRGLEFASPPAIRAAIVISRMMRVKARPRFASVAAFLCLIVAHFECPDMILPRLFHVTAAHRDHRYKNFCAAERLGQCRPIRGPYSRWPCRRQTSRDPKRSRQQSRPSYGRQEKPPPVRRLTVNGEPQTPADPR